MVKIKAKKRLTILLVISIILGLLLIIGYIFMPTSIVKKTTLNNLPKLAYINIQSVKLVDSSSVVRDIFVISADGSSKKITTFDKPDLQPGRLLYSPYVDKLIINTDKGVFLIDPVTGEQKNIYKVKGKIWNIYLTKDGKYVCPMVDGGAKVKIQLDNLKVIPDYTTRKSYFKNDCEKDKQPMFDEKNNLLVDVQAVDVTLTDYGSYVNSSEVLVTNITTGEVKKFKYNNSGSIEPIFLNDNYLYFINQGTGGGYDGSTLIDLMQMDLNTGEVNDPTSFPIIKNKIDKGVFIERVGISPSGNYFLYKTPSSEDKYYMDFYLYDVEAEKEIVINKTNSKFVVGPATWTSDERYLNIDGFIYDTKENKKYHVNNIDPTVDLVFMQ